MDEQEKIEFVRGFMSRIAEGCVKKIEEGQVPKDWDGHELRKWLADLLHWEVSNLMLDGRSARARKYRNDRAIHDLY